MAIKSNENEDATGQQGKKKKEKKKQETKQGSAGLAERQREVSRAAGGGGSRVEDSRANRSDQRHFVSFKCFFLHCFRHLPFTLYVSLTHTHTYTRPSHTYTHTHTPGLPCPGGHFTNLFISPSAANAAFFPCLQFIWLVVVADPPPPLIPSLPPLAIRAVSAA